jgi:hypothetical protein
MTAGRFPGEPKLFKIVFEDIEETRHTDFVVAVTMQDAIDFALQVYRDADSIWEELTIDSLISVEKISDDFIFTNRAFEYYDKTDKKVSA